MDIIPYCFRCIGFTSATNKVTVVNGSAETSFTLRESAIQSEEVVVSASPYAREADDLYQPAESKSRLELQASPGASFAEKISDMPGVDVRYNGSAPARPMVRGLSDNEVLVLETAFERETSPLTTPRIPFRYSRSAFHGSTWYAGRHPSCMARNRIGGLVNVITNTIPMASTNPFSGTVSLAGSTPSHEYTGSFDGVYSHGGQALGVSFGGLHSQDIGIPTGNYFDGIQIFKLNLMPQSFDRSQRVAAGYSYQGDFGMVGIGYEHYQMTYGVPGTAPPNPDWINDPPTTSLIAQNKNMVEMRSLYVPQGGDGAFVREIKLNVNDVDYNHEEYPTLQDSTGISNPQANHFNKRAVNATLQLQHSNT